MSNEPFTFGVPPASLKPGEFVEFIFKPNEPGLARYKRVHALMREAVREYVRACARSPHGLTREQHRAMVRGNELLRALETFEG